MPNMPATTPESSFKNPLRAGVTLIVLLLALGQLSGRLFNINSIDNLAYEKILRADLLEELKYLSVTAAEAGNSTDQTVYDAALQSEFQFDASKLRDTKTADAAKASKAKASRRWPIQSRRENWEQRQLQFTTTELVQQGIRDTRKQRPFLSGNDRSRWMTVRSLVELGTYEIDEFVTKDAAWDTIDMVAHLNTEGEQRLYSSKPPLQATLIAGPYWVINRLTGMTLGTQPFEVGRILLFVVNILPLLLAWYWCARLIDEWTETDLAFVVTLLCLCFATLITPFATVLTNHLWGAVSAVATTWYGTRCWQGSRRALDFMAVGFWAAFTFTCELPAASFLGMMGLLLLFKVPRPTIVLGIPAVLLVVGAYFGANYLAHGKWSPPYSFGAGDVNTSDSKTAENWYDYEYIRQTDGKKVESYWRKPNNPLDLGEANSAHYLFHSLIGHHGIFSLTPLFLLTFPGLYLLIRQGRSDQRSWAIVVTITSLVCLAFYLFLLDTRQRNYGGQSSAFRQLLWLHPLWILAATPMIERLLKAKSGQWLLGILAAFSILAASYNTWNPWTQTWIWNMMLWLGLNPLSGTT
jgi:hypothetical protein